MELGLYASILYVSCDLKRSLNAIKKQTRVVKDITSEGKSNISTNIRKLKTFFVVIFFTMLVGSIVQTL